MVDWCFTRFLSARPPDWSKVHERGPTERLSLLLQLDVATASPKLDSDRHIDRYLEFYKNQVARGPAVSLLVRSWRTYRLRKFFLQYIAMMTKNR